MQEDVAQLALLCLASSVLLVAAGLFTTVFRLRSPIAFLLATNLIAWAMLVSATLVLSPFHLVRSVTAWSLLIASLVIAASSWQAAARPTPPFAGLRRMTALALKEPLVQVLTIVAGVAFLYMSALAVITPENEGDALAYHVARAAFWYQHHGLSYVANAVESRLNVNPPNAEIGVLFTMLVSGTQRLVGLVQLSSSVICMLAVAGIARRIGARADGAAWVGLLVLTLPVVATQAPTAQNDLVVAAFLITAAFFSLGETRQDSYLAGLALALAIGTKFTAVLSIPVLLLVALVAPSQHRWRKTAWLLGPGLLGGSIWYVVNLVRTGHLDGGLAASAAQTPTSVHVVGGTFVRFVLDAFDLSGLTSAEWGVGVLGVNSYAYRLVGFALLLGGLLLVLRERHPRASRSLCIAGAIIAAVPSVVVLSYRLLYRLAHAHVHGLAHGPNVTAGATPSWYGPLGVLGVAAGIVVVIRARRVGAATGITLALALAPIILALCLALGLVWDPWRGRFFIFAFLLAASSWHLMLRPHWLSWAVTATACVTIGVVLANTLAKPSGFRRIGGDPSQPVSIWAQPDWQAQSILRPGGDERNVYRVVRQEIPPHSSVALAPRGNDLIAPYFGPNLTRRITLSRDGGTVDPRATWLLAAPGVRPVVCPGEWRVVTRPAPNWIVARTTKRRPECPEAMRPIR